MTRSFSPRLFITAAPFLATALGGYHLSSKLSSPPGQQPAPVAQGTIDIDQQRVFFPATVHGDTTTLILDLGTSANLISRAEATRLKIAGAADASQVRLDSMRIGSSVRHNLSLRVIDGEFGGASIVMGAPFQSAYDLVFDGPSHSVSLYTRPPRSPAAAGTAKRPSWFPQGVTPQDCVRMTGDEYGFQRVFIPIQLNGHAIHSMFDSGTSSTNVNLYGAQEGGLTQASGKVHDITGVVGHLGPYAAISEGIGAVMTINGRPLAEDSVTIFPHIPREKQGPGIKDAELSLGLGAVRDRVMYISYSTNQLCLGAPAAQGAAQN